MIQKKHKTHDIDISSCQNTICCGLVILLKSNQASKPGKKQREMTIYHPLAVTTNS